MGQHLRPHQHFRRLVPLHPRLLRGSGRSAGYPFAKRMQKVAALGLAALEISLQKGEDPNDEIFEEPTPRAAAYNAIDTERDYQNAMSVGPDGRTDGLQKSVGDYLTLIRVYSARADEAYSGTRGTSRPCT